MGKITLTVEGSTVGTIATGGGLVIERSVSEQDSGRLIAAYAKVYTGKWLNGDGTPRAPSITEVIEAWFDGIISGSVAAVCSVERQTAPDAAAAAVQPISVT
jgi:hypothetical protein